MGQEDTRLAELLIYKMSIGTKPSDDKVLTRAQSYNLLDFRTEVVVNPSLRTMSERTCCMAGKQGVNLGSSLPSFGEEKEAIPRTCTIKLSGRHRDSGNFLLPLTFQSRFLPPSLCPVLLGAV